MPASATQGSPFENLLADILLRLEKTNGGSALAYPFSDEAMCKRAHASMIRMIPSRTKIKRYAVITRGLDADGTPTLYVRRGPNWIKPE